jgi:asparagine synthase (glutamine-hydrolysing)
VVLRLRADVPVGCYLSGGLDSAVIASLANERSAETLHTFGITFADPRFDEGAEQERVATHLGSRHHRTLCDGAAIRDALEQVVWHCETPLLRTAPVPLFLLSRFVAAQGIRTVLTGEGADELLAGYTLFKEDAIRRFWARRPQSVMRPALFDRIHHYVGPGTAKAGAVWRAFFGRELTKTGHPFYSHLVRWRNTAWTLRLLAPEARAGFDLDIMMAEAARAMPDGWSELDPLRRAQLIEMRSFLSSYLLACQGDRVAMAHGVEARYPFLDHNLVDFCLALPRDCKMLGLRDKLVLRRLAARRLPPAVWKRPKQPFRAPIGPALFALVDAGMCDNALVERTAAERLIAKARTQNGVLAEREEMGLVGMLTLSMLSRHFGATFAARAAEARAALERSPLHVFEDHSATSIT